MEINNITNQCVDGNCSVTRSTNNQTQQNECSSCYADVTTDSNDTDAVLQTTAKKEAGAIVNVNADNFDEEVRNNEGTTFVVIGKQGCGRCSNFAPVLEQINSELGGEAKFTHLSVDDDKESNLLWQLIKESGVKNLKCSNFPAIIKIVNGKAVEYIDFKDIGNKYTNKDAMVSLLSSKIEGNISAGTTTASTTPTEATQATSATTATTATKATANSAIIKAYQEAVQETLISQIKNQINSATTIGNLKNIMVSVTGLDSDIQISIVEYVTKLNSDSDLDAAKKGLLKLL